MKISDHPLRVLLVDDDEVSLEVMTLQIGGQGHHVEPVESGDAAMRLLEHMPEPGFDVMLTDLQMPGLSGVELARAVRTTAPGLLLLAMSGSKPAAGVAEAYDGFLLKPFSMDTLESALRGRSASPLGAPHSNPLADHRTLDEGVYASLAASMPAAQLQQLYMLCLDDAALRMTRMRTAGTAGDDATYRREAHAVKGGCSMVGAMELRRLAAAAELEGLDAANHVASLDEMMIAVERLRRILIAREDRPTE